MGEGPIGERDDAENVAERPAERDAGVDPGDGSDGEPAPPGDGDGAGSDAGAAPPEGPPSTTDCDFQALVSPCGACHSLPFLAGGLDLLSPGLEERVIGVDAQKSACGSGKLVDLSAPEQSVLYLRLVTEECSTTSTHIRPPDMQACMLGWIKSL